MAEVQDEDQWLYGDDKENASVGKAAQPSTTENEAQPTAEDESTSKEKPPEESETAETNGEMREPEEKSKEDEQEDAQEPQQNGEKEKSDEDESSSDDEPTVTIGKIVKQPDILRPPPPTHRAAPTSGLKDEDFTSVGKINGVPITDYNLAELEEKPWRKPGADLSDYFNYGFVEDTWLKYCERQKAMRTNESGIGLVGLGINIGKSMLASSNIPVSIVNENSKYGGVRKPAGVPIIKTKIDDDGSGNQNFGVNTIQVMTADRRTYSSKVLAGSGAPNVYDDMDFGGSPYGDFFNTPPPNFFTPPPPTGSWGGVPNIPPPGWAPGGMGVPPPMSHHHRGGGGGYFDEDPVGPIGGSSRPSKEDKEMEKMRDIPEPRLSRERESRHHSSRRRSRSRSKSRHRRRTRSRSRSRSPSHRHKRKKSKRERETD